MFHDLEILEERLEQHLLDGKITQRQYEERLLSLLGDYDDEDEYHHPLHQEPAEKFYFDL
jgi:hypothetical protein